MSTLHDDNAPGRSCPLHYRYAPEVFATPAALSDLDVLYVVGGLYGNELALAPILERLAGERGRARLVFNGDFHWFDSDPEVFSRVQREVLAHTALRGNVETELATEQIAGGAGCGCAYPDWVDDTVVQRSNRILHRLREATNPVQRAQLAALPMWLRADVGDFRIAIVHGDAQSLAGWGFSQERLRDAAHRDTVRRWFARADVHAFASTHTCLPVFQRLRTEASGRAVSWIFNNGAAGMPNFAADRSGLLTRIALSPAPGEGRRFGVRIGDVFVDAIAVDFDPDQARSIFLRQWAPGSDAHASYFQRITRGPDYRVSEAIRTEE